MDVYLTGGTGLVGSHTIELLTDHGHRVRALVRDEPGKTLVESLGAEAFLGSIEDPCSWDHAEGSDAIVHSAAIITKRGEWEKFYSINVGGTRKAAEKAAHLGVRLVHISSVAVYGRREAVDGGRLTEDFEWDHLPKSEFYALSKRGAEDAVTEVARTSSLSAVSLRPCVIYGERDRTFLPHVIRVLRYGVSPVVGGGENTLALVYAGNVAEAVMSALERPEVQGAVNITNDGDTTQREFFASVGRALGKRVRFVKVPVPIAYAFAALLYGVRHIMSPGQFAGFGATAVKYLTSDNPYSSERARNELNWKPKTRPREAIDQSVRWFAERR